MESDAIPNAPDRPEAVAPAPSTPATIEPMPPAEWARVLRSKLEADGGAMDESSRAALKTLLANAEIEADPGKPLADLMRGAAAYLRAFAGVLESIDWSTAPPRVVS